MEHSIPIWELAKTRALGAAVLPDAEHVPTPSSAMGLSTADAVERLRRYGPNEFPPPPRPRLILRFINQLTHFMALLLWVAGALAFFAGTPLIGISIWSVVLINGVFSFAQEYRAERALAALTQLLPLHAKVYRDGVLTIIPARELVIGDVIELEEGDKVPTDARLIAAQGLLVEMSAITGESVPVIREALSHRPLALTAEEASPTPMHQRVGDTTTIVLAGTTVLAGTGRALTYATGAHTECGHLASLATAAEKAPNRLEVEISYIVEIITAIACSMGVAVFAIAYGVIGLHPIDSLMLGIGILVANVPEGLLPTVSVALALGVQRMARCNALVRKLSAIEGLSAVSVLCTDKTGTLTRNSMSVHTVWTPDDGGPSIQHGVPIPNPGASSPLPPLHQSITPHAQTLLVVAAICTHHQTDVKSDRSTSPSPIGDPTEVAIREAASASGTPLSPILSELTIIDELSFDSRRRMMSVIVEVSESAGPTHPVRILAPLTHTLVITKGAPDSILKRATHLYRGGAAEPITSDRRRYLATTYDTIARSGFRVLAVAFRTIDRAEPPDHRDAIEHNLIMLGYIALFDPIRPEVPDAIASCREAGISICMITGDYGATAQAIGEMIGLHGLAGKPITGDEVASMTDGQLRNLLHAHPGGIFARMDPDQKLRLVQTLRDLGHVVAVTGDGVNDAPALKAAHVGFAMGLRGTDVAREVADVVLLDDNFATIVSAIAQGRATFDNIRRFLTYILASNIPELVPFICMAALGIPPALTIIQILLVDLGTDLAPAVALGMEKPAHDVMKRPPIRPGERLLSWRLIGRAYGLLGVWEAFAAMGAFFLVWYTNGYGLAQIQGATRALLTGEASPAAVQLYATATAATFLTIVASQMGNVFACRSERLPVWRQPRPTNRLLWVGLTVEALLLLSIGNLPLGHHVFGNKPLSYAVWGWLVASPLALICLDGLAKWVQQRW